MAQFMVNRLYERRVDDYLQVYAANRSTRRGSVKGSQISRLREIIEDALQKTNNGARSADVEPVLRFINGLRSDTRQKVG